jgi:hypothetical protein
MFGKQAKNIRSSIQKYKEVFASNKWGVTADDDNRTSSLLAEVVTVVECTI